MSDHFHYLSGEVRHDHEDLRQEAWLKALSRTEHRPNAETAQDLIDNYQHIAGLVVHIFRHEKIKSYQKPPTTPLTDDVGMVYNMDDPLEDCTPLQREAISYYLHVTGQDRPLTPAERIRLSRYRKSTGLSLHVDRTRRENATT